MSESVRILVVKTSSLGDVVHALPAVSDVAAAHPKATIDWVCEEGFAGIPAMHPSMDRVIPCAIRRWRKSWWSSDTRNEIAAFRRALQRDTYDAVIDFQGLIKSAWIVRKTRGPSHGYAWGSAREPLSTLAYDVRHSIAWGQHAIVRNRALAAAALGYTPEGPVRYGLKIDGSQRSGSESGRIAVDRTVQPPTMIALHSTSRADKAWPESNWRTIVERVAARGFDVVLPWGSNEERERSLRIAQGITRARVPERMDMQTLAATFKAATIVVGVDTGLVHLAVASGAPVIAIFGPTDPRLTGVVAERAPAVDLGGNGSMPDVGAVDDAIEAMLAQASASLSLESREVDRP